MTAHHLDRATKLLRQGQGHHAGQWWDPHDDTVMRPAQRDHLFRYDDNARAAHHAGLAL